MSKDINHSERAHALLSASGAYRWMKCTPSARLEESFKGTTSVHAAEGTLAHEFSELELGRHNKSITEEYYNSQIKELRLHSLYTDEMEGEVQKYVDFVLEMLSNSKGGELVIEEKVSFSAYVPGGFGSCDTNILPGKSKTLYVIDLKYGKGIQVFAKGNPQLKLYALGAYLNHCVNYDIDHISMSIVQPRLDHFDTDIISVKELIDWAVNELKPTADIAYKGEGELCAGNWCKFCKVAPKCRALSEFSLKEAKADFITDEVPSSVLSDSELAKMFLAIPTIENWINSVKEFMLNQAVTGTEYEGLKLVEGRSVRTWADSDKVAETLADNLYSEKDIYVKKVAGITAIEKLLGKKGFTEILGELVVKPQGKPTLVPESDKRPPYSDSSGKKDFE